MISYVIKKDDNISTIKRCSFLEKFAFKIFLINLFTKKFYNNTLKSYKKNRKRIVFFKVTVFRHKSNKIRIFVFVSVIKFLIIIKEYVFLS